MLVLERCEYWSRFQWKLFLQDMFVLSSVPTGLLVGTWSPVMMSGINCVVLVWPSCCDMSRYMYSSLPPSGSVASMARLISLVPPGVTSPKLRSMILNAVGPYGVTILVIQLCSSYWKALDSPATSVMLVSRPDESYRSSAFL